VLDTGAGIVVEGEGVVKVVSSLGSGEAGSLGGDTLVVAVVV
jgi:hypothetical protein